MSLADKEALVSNQAVASLDLPEIVSDFTDGPVGAPAGINSNKSGTGLPSASALGATFDPAMARRYGHVTGNDAVKYGYYGIWGPTLNTLRTPLAGRGEEYFGEDPYLIGRLGTAEVRAEQKAGAMVQIKHYVANDQEGQDGVPIITGTAGGRMLVNVHASKRTLHEVYLAPFATVIAKADPASVMCSYNRLNGPYACESPWLLKTALRKELHFKGWVSPDAGADHNPTRNFNAGEQTGYHGAAELAPLLSSGAISKAQLDSDVHDILRSFFDHGVFDRPAYTDQHSTINVAKERRTALRIEESAATLLVNRHHTLPLRASRTKTIAVIGDAANRYLRGSGSPEVSPYRHQTLLQGLIRRAGAHIAVTYDDGSDPTAAAALAKSSDVAIVAAGDSETEGTDKVCMSLDCPSLGLPDLQNHDPQISTGQPNELISAVAATQPKTVVVLETGEPVLTPWRSHVGALLEAWYPGEAGGSAIAHLLFGDVNPSGHLSSTFPRSDTDGPGTSATAHPRRYPGNAAEQEFYSDALRVGYRWYDAKHRRVAFPFGHGLSYTHFRFMHLRLSHVGHRVRVSWRVGNTGRRAGRVVGQVYVHDPKAAQEPPQRLVGFASKTLGPGRSLIMHVDLAAASFRQYRHGHWMTTPGRYAIRVGDSSRHEPLRGVVRLRR
jgi:beta-glucosidase